MPNSPLVGIVIPAYNAAPYIVEALQSVFSQTHTNYEVIVVNDGSPDTAELEKVLAPYLDRLKYITQANKGAGAARNTAIGATSAEFIALLDADDIWEPTFLVDQLSYIGKHPELDLVYGDAVFLGGPLTGKRYMDVCPSVGEATFEALVDRRCHVMIGVLARRSALIDAGLFSEAMRRCEDFDLWGRFAKAGHRIGYHRKVLIKYRRSGQGKSSNAAGHLLGEIAIYKKFERDLALTENEKAIIKGRLEQYHGELLLVEAKAEFDKKQFSMAASKVSAANSILLRQRLAMASLLLQTCPGLVYSLYNLRTTLQNWRVARM